MSVWDCPKPPYPHAGSCIPEDRNQYEELLSRQVENKVDIYYRGNLLLVGINYDKEKKHYYWNSEQQKFEYRAVGMIDSDGIPVREKFNIVYIKK